MSGTRVSVTLGAEWVEVRDAAAWVTTLGMLPRSGLEDAGLRVCLRVAAGCLLMSLPTDLILQDDTLCPLLSGAALVQVAQGWSPSGSVPGTLKLCCYRVSWERATAIQVRMQCLAHTVTAAFPD